MKRIQKVLISIAIAGSLGIVGAAYAYDSSGNYSGGCMYDGGMGGMHGMDGRMGRRGGKDAANLQAMIDKHLEKIKGELKITAAQEGAWQAFAGKRKQQASDAQAMREKLWQGASATTAAAPIPAPERMEKGIEFMKQRLSQMETMHGALKDLYAALTPEQRTAADKLFGHQAEQRRERMQRRSK